MVELCGGMVLVVEQSHRKVLVDRHVSEVVEPHVWLVVVLELRVVNKLEV